ncbi:type II toxin-antitoxin system RelE/ParE family toxin [Flammeovirga sp. MY04]|uniref:type II toxin-antitoxin system RelE/ParE family toxin n=1 Tax=Flammeovirga sp. MY04 TaxID=1191459 RepID=UPI00080615BA|nr:type II toxin-antitoxin system RelE/ParE family toxin [Flammeovirga sp. MY04]ANQ51863.1 type II toxin-antitoxin system RelE/ParE family toxin [Flammeovirga sp. MY04]
MNYDIIATEPFGRKLKKLAKKHKSLKADLLNLFNELAENPTLGTPLGKECYKIRMSISSKGKGKSGGARIITYVRIINKKIFLLDIYDKSEQDTISDKDLKLLIDLLANE